MKATAILIFNKCLYLRGRLRLTTARRLSAYMSSRALAMTTASSFHYVDILQINTWMDGQMDGWMDGWIAGYMHLYLMNSSVMLHTLK